MRGWLARLALAAGSALLALALAELSARALAYAADAREIRALRRLGSAPVPTGARVHLRHMLRVSEHRRIVYELRPSLSVRFLGARVTTNPDGFRGPAVPRGDPGDAFRIVGLGDSLMFGWAVDDGEAYLPRLAERLRVAQPERAWEVVNTAVPGYNTVMEVELLERRGLAYRPDLVLLHFVHNDLALPNFIRAHRPYRSLRTSFLLAALRPGLAQPPERAHELREAPIPEGERGYEYRPERVPPEYRDLVGPEAAVAAFERLGQLAEEHGFGVLVLFQRAMPEQIDATIRASGFTSLDWDPCRRSYMQRHGISDPRGVLTVSQGDWHPSATAHQVIADCLYDGLRASGLLDRERSAASR